MVCVELCSHDVIDMLVGDMMVVCCAIICCHVYPFVFVFVFFLLCSHFVDFVLCLTDATEGKAIGIRVGAQD